MRMLLKICLVGLGALALALIGLFAWLEFDSSGLPDTQGLARFAPVKPIQVSGECQASATVAIPYESIGENLRVALEAAEVGDGDPGVLSEILEGSGNHGRVHAALSLHISRTMFCAPEKPLIHNLNEIRAAVQLERHFSRQVLFTIFANRLYFGESAVGVEAASQHYFHKEPNQLQLGEAALLAGLVKAPSRFSPAKHPGRALQRRNEVIDEMVNAHSISESDAAEAKSMPLPPMN